MHHAFNCSLAHTAMKIRRFGCRIGRFLFHSYRDFCRNNVGTVGRNDIPTECHHGQPMFLYSYTIVTGGPNPTAYLSIPTESYTKPTESKVK